MSIDETPISERTFTETHDRILHALVEQVHDMGLRLAALEATQGPPTPISDARTEDGASFVPPTVPPEAASTASSNAHNRRQAREHVAAQSRPIDQPNTKTRSGRVTGWQPARR